MILKIGHRGAMGYEPANTLKSFETAVSLGVDMIELDVHAKDGEIFVIHDIEKWTLETPRLSEVLDFIKRRVKVDIELKGDAMAKPVANLLRKYLDNGWATDDFLISSFKPKELEDFKKEMPQINTALLVKKDNFDYLVEAKKLKCFSINMSIDCVKKNEEVVNNIHNKGFKIIIWTVNSPRKIKWLKELEVDGICSDYPDRLSKFL